MHANQGDEGALITAMNTFYNAVRSLVPSGVQWTSPTAGVTIDELSGHVNGAWSAGAAGPVSSNGINTWANGVGMRITFPTIGVVAGRKVTGALFLVPLMTSSYEGAGNIVAGTLTTVGTAAITLATTPNALRIYSRPSPTHGGISFPALTATVPDKVSWLRSRRI